MHRRRRWKKPWWPGGTQYHAQDELGQASFGYAYPGQAATNLRDGFGNQIGSYAYINQKESRAGSPRWKFSRYSAVVPQALVLPQ